LESDNKAVKTRELFQELEKNKLYPVYLLLGEDNGGKNSFLDRLAERTHYGKEGRGLDKTVFFGSDAQVQHVIEELRTFSMFLEKKLVVVKEFEKLREGTTLAEYMVNPNDESILVVMTDQVRVQKKVMGAAEHSGRVCIFWHMFEDESERWIRNRLNVLGVEAEKDALRYIIELCGTGRNELSNQIAIIGNYLSKGEMLTLDRAQDIVSQLHSSTVFDLCNSLFVGSVSELLAIFHNLLDNGESVGKIFFFCNREIQRIFKAWSLRAAGENFKKIEQLLTLRKRDARRIQNLVQRMKLPHFLKLFGQLQLLDQTLKSSPRELGILQFEQFIATLGIHRKGE
jgi:DNA polymerase-3 subunit delta